jgi:CRP/FNR family transcriptional regulator
MASRCLAYSLSEAEAARLEQFLIRRRIARGEWLYRTGDDFLSLYGVLFGHFKTV